MTKTLLFHIARRFTATALWTFATVLMLVVIVGLVEFMRAQRGREGGFRRSRHAVLRAPWGRSELPDRDEIAGPL